MATDITGTLDTEAVQGGTNTHPKDDPTQYLDKTPSTLEPGGPVQHANPAYAAPPKDTPGTVVDTTWTDRPTTDGIEHLDTPGNMTGNIDTVNFSPALRTTTANTPATPGAAPTVAAKTRGIEVTIVPLADPAGAEINAYRVEAARVATSGADPGTNTAPGVDFIETGQTKVVMGTLTPGDLYKFRFAGINDNGTGAFSAWSTAITPLNPEDNISGTPDAPTYPTAVWPENTVNGVYKPDGSFEAAAGSTKAVTGVAAVWSGGASPFTLTVSWTAPAAGGTPASYDVTVNGTGLTTMSGNSATSPKTFTHAGASLGAMQKTLSIRIKANPSLAARTSAVTAT